MLLIESGLVLICFLMALLAPSLGTFLFARIEKSLAGLSRRRLLSVIAVGLTALGLRLLLLPILPIPDPVLHDEFSYLLMADTFAHGRITNPTHPMWVYFETFHEIQQPTHASMYYPAQGLFLAFGQAVLGHPFWGVWLSAGLMSAAMCWMLQGWLPPFWALLGGLIAVIRLATFSYWMNSYWGGAVAALGGALVLGALPRIRRSQRLRDVLLLGLGFALVANSRPYEGLFFAVPVVFILVFWMKTRRASLLQNFRRIVLPLGLLFFLTLAAMGYYFWRTTGSPVDIPYAVNTAVYRPAPLFPWQSATYQPQYHHLILEKFYRRWAMGQYQFARSHPFALIILKFWMAWFFFVGPLFTLPLIVLCLVLPYGMSFRDLGRRTRLLLAVCFSVLLAAALPVCFEAHYIAPITCALYALVLMAMMKVRRWKPHGKPSGIAVVRAVALVAALMTLIRGGVPTARANEFVAKTWCSPVLFKTYRGAILSQLSRTPGLHLVIVRYRPDHDPITDWVHNGADIDRSKVVWARDMGTERNAELIRYFKGRNVWLVEPDVTPPRLSSYPLNMGNESVSASHKVTPEVPQ